MKRSILTRVQILFLLLCLAFAIAPAHAQDSAHDSAHDSAQASTHSEAQTDSASGEKTGHDSGQTSGQNSGQNSDPDDPNQYRHSAAVQFVARTLHAPLETTAKSFEYLNFAILAGSILYFIVKFVPKLFRDRGDGIAKQLIDARTATEQANERLGGVEARLSRLDDEIAAIRKQVEQDAAQDEVRIKAALEDDKKRISEAAGHEVEAADAAAQRELRRFAAELAIERATGDLSLTPEMDRRLVSSFAREIAGDKFNGGRN